MYTRTTQFLDICEFEILGAYADTVNEMTTAVKHEGPLRGNVQSFLKFLISRAL